MDKAKGLGQRISLGEKSPGERCHQCNPGGYYRAFCDIHLVVDHIFGDSSFLSALRRSFYGWRRCTKGGT